ncbi:hypothetical protein NHX12_001008 [Muraenolepis orangiensis]|uniref:Ig-like domain-containing protein n=1 Tax=Muraenolepis orangiensis TaxID=630683 RepID=A0A9Q0E292_9TELE|nr:hypothetical protein NHX12_001008 [Muraenolepis orangiensis]
MNAEGLRLAGKVSRGAVVVKVTPMVEALRGASSSLPCSHTVSPPSANMVVEWYIVSGRARIRVAFHSQSGDSGVDPGTPLSGRSSMAQDSSLVIDAVQPSDEGVFVCQVTGGPAGMGEASTQLKVFCDALTLPPPSPSDPHPASPLPQRPSPCLPPSPSDPSPCLPPSPTTLTLPPPSPSTLTLPPPSPTTLTLPPPSPSDPHPASPPPPATLTLPPPSPSRPSPCLPPPPVTLTLPPPSPSDPHPASPLPQRPSPCLPPPPVTLTLPPPSPSDPHPASPLPHDPHPHDPHPASPLPQRPSPCLPPPPATLTLPPPSPTTLTLPPPSPMTLTLPPPSPSDPHPPPPPPVTLTLPPLPPPPVTLTLPPPSPSDPHLTLTLPPPSPMTLTLPPPSPSDPHPASPSPVTLTLPPPSPIAPEKPELTQPSTQAITVGESSSSENDQPLAEVKDTKEKTYMVPSVVKEASDLFTVLSGLYMQPSKEDKGSVFKCTVEYTLPNQQIQKKTSDPITINLNCGALFSVALIVRKRAEETF